MAKVIVELDDYRYNREMKNVTSAVKYALRMFRRHGIGGSVYQTKPYYFTWCEFTDEGWTNQSGFENREWFKWCQECVEKEPLSPGDWCYKEA